jgi:hypothetical protein
MLWIEAVTPMGRMANVDELVGPAIFCPVKRRPSARASTWSAAAASYAGER